MCSCVICMLIFSLWLSRFSENIDNDPGHVDVPASVIPKHLHHLVKPIKRYKSLGSTSRHKEKEFRIVTEQNTLHSILQHVPDDKVLISCFLSDITSGFTCQMS